MNIRLAIAAGAALMMMASLAAAQTSTSTATTHTPTATTHAAATTTHASMASGEAISCRTHHAAGEACRCTKAPTRAGTAEAGANGGHAMCMVPAHT